MSSEGLFPIRTAWVDTEVARARALVIDSNPSTRIGLAKMLREYGVEQLQHTSSVQDARRMLELRRFDIVVCDMHFPDEPMTGQDLLDDLRLANLLPLSTVFILLSPDAVYAKVAEAAEAASDGYLIKPHTQKALRDRLAMARQRKHALKDVTERIEREAFAEAAQLCQQRVEQRSADWLLAARVGAELWLRVGQPRAALAMFESIHEAKAIPWAKLGIARANHEAGSLAKARRTLESLLIEQPGYCDAYDVMGRVLIEQGEYPDALAALRKGAALAPGCIARVQKLGLLAFYHGDRKEAADALQRASQLGAGSASFDLQSLALLAALHFDGADLKALQRTTLQLAQALELSPRSARVRRFADCAKVLKLLAERQVADAVQVMRTLMAEVRSEDFEIEAACNLLMVLARVISTEVQIDSDATVRSLAQRFAVSRATCDLLCRSAHPNAAIETAIREAYASTCREAEQAISHTIGGAPREAVLALLAQGERSLNAKLLDLAALTLERHRGAIAAADELMQQAASLRERYCSAGTQVRLAPAAPASA